MKIVKDEKFRSLPGVNHCYDMRRITVYCTMIESRKLKEFIENNPDDFPSVRNKNIADISSEDELAKRLSYSDPNRTHNNWSKIFTSSEEIEKYGRLNKYRLERWVNGSPGVDLGYVLVKRFIQIIAGKPQPFMSLRLRGNMEITEEQANHIRRQFLGDFELNG
jgi:hypothetical protein